MFTKNSKKEEKLAITTDPLNFMNLPNEIIARVFRFLDYRTLTRMHRVCNKSNEIISSLFEPKFGKYQLRFAELLKLNMIEEALKFIKKHPFPTNYIIDINDEENKLVARTSVIHLLCQSFEIGDNNKNKLIELFHLCINARANLNFVQQKKINIPLPFPHISYVLQTPLLYALTSKNKDLFDLLIDNGADVNLGVDKFNNPLTTAAEVANTGNIYFLLQLLKKQVIIDPSHVLELAKDKSGDLTWRLIYLKMLIAFISQQAIPSNSEKATVVNGYLQRLAILYQETTILSSEENPSHFTNAELLQFQTEVGNMQAYMFELLYDTDLDELEEPPSKKPNNTK